MNAYSTEFFSVCPNNGIRIRYRLRIETRDMLSVEEIIAAVELEDEGYHEEVADRLLTRFGGTQTLIAEHHGVTIETIRTNAAPAERNTGGTNSSTENATEGLNMAIELCNDELVDFAASGAFEDDVYNTAIRDCIRSIRAALARQAAAPAKTKDAP